MRIKRVTFYRAFTYSELGALNVQTVLKRLKEYRCTLKEVTDGEQLEKFNNRSQYLTVLSATLFLGIIAIYRDEIAVHQDVVGLSVLSAVLFLSAFFLTEGPGALYEYIIAVISYLIGVISLLSSFLLFSMGFISGIIFYMIELLIIILVVVSIRNIILTIRNVIWHLNQPVYDE